VVCLSQWDRGEFLRRALVSPGRLVHIPNCVDTVFFRAPPTLSPASLGLPAEGPLIAFVGRLTDQKGVADLIRASPVIRAAHAGARVIIAGDGPLRAQLEAMAGRIAPGTVTFMGGLLDPLPAFQVADVVVVPSRFEPLGIVAAESLALGKPVVASRIGGLTDIVEHEDTGLLISPGQPRELADAVCRMLDQPEAAREMAARGRRAVQARFSEEAVLPRYRDLYRQLVKDG
jgi:glycogen(starch) synthase